MTDEVKAAFDAFVMARKVRNLRSADWVRARDLLEKARQREAKALEHLESVCFREAGVVIEEIPVPKNPEDFFDQQVFETAPK